MHRENDHFKEKWRRYLFLVIGSAEDRTHDPQNQSLTRLPLNQRGSLNTERGKRIFNLSIQ